MQSLMHKYVQKVSSDSGPYALLEGALDSGLNVALEGEPHLSFL